MFERVHRHKSPFLPYYASQLFDEGTFYAAFTQDLNRCSNYAFIESPYITSKRVAHFLPIFRKLTKRGVRVIVNTRHPQEHEMRMRLEARDAVQAMQELGASVLYTGALHRKLALMDDRLLWEGSLNILSQYDSCEIMRRIESEAMVSDLRSFIRIDINA